MARTYVYFVNLFAAFTALISADVQFVQPEAGSQYRSGSVPTVAWTDSGNPPALTDLISYTLNLCAGGNVKGSFMCPLAVLKTDGLFDGSDITAGLMPISSAIGGNSQNGYFLQMVSTAVGGTIVYNYSPRFGMTGMRGAFTPVVAAGIQAIGTSSQGPPSSKEDAETTTTSSLQAPSAAFNIPYNRQEGSIRYAPMQPLPPTKITAKTAKPLWPTSQAKTARKIMRRPWISTTVTQSMTYTAHSRENSASPAPNPQDDMSKWLARWKD